MIALLTPTGLAMLVAILRGRSLVGLGTRRVVWWPLGLAALLVEAVLSGSPLAEQNWAVTWGSAIWIAALAAMAATLARNAWLRSSGARIAWAVAALGVSLNLVVVVVNDGHMPQLQAARIAAGASTERVAGLATTPGWRNIAPMSSESKLGWLGDILPEPAFLPLRNVMSIGDMLLAIGLAGAAYLATDRRRSQAAAALTGRISP